MVTIIRYVIFIKLFGLQLMNITSFNHHKASDVGTILLFTYLFMAALGLRCCAQAFSSCGERELLFVEEHGLLIAVASLVAKHEL